MPTRDQDDNSSRLQRRVYLEERLWRDWPSLRYLLPETPNLVLLDESRALLPATEGEVQIIVWPYTEHSQYLALLPQEHVISVTEGPLERGDLEKQARLLCLIYQAMPATDVPSNLQVQFEKGIELLGYELQSAQGRTCLRLFWRARASVDADYSVFVHLRRGDQVVTQDDSYPAQGHYPTHLWRDGDIVVDDHWLEATAASGEGYSLSVGLYQLQTMQRLQVLDDAGNRIADSVTIRLP